MQIEQVTLMAAATAEENAAAAEELTAQSETLTDVAKRLTAIIGLSSQSRSNRYLLAL
jgi:methyl-accepting chemotaxis protein